MRALVALLFLIASCSAALATIKVCNEFSHPLHLAFAYEAKDGWASDGWITVASNACAIDTQHPDLTSFYYRAESETFNGNKWVTWGNDREFSVKDGNFRLEHAEKEVKGARLVKFNGPDTFTDPLTLVTLTFAADLKVTFSIPNENVGGAPAAGASPPAPPSGGTTPSVPNPPASAAVADPKSNPDFQTCKTASGDESIAACDRAIASGKFGGSLLAELYVYRGVEHSNKEDYDLAIADYNKAIESDPNFALAYENRGKRYSKSRDYNRALSDLTKAIQLNPTGARAYDARGGVYEAKKDNKRAMADYSKAIEVNPQFAIAYVDRGNIYFNEGDYTRAMADFEKAIELDPNYALAYCNRGAVHSRRSEYDQAIADLTKAIELAPNFALAYTNRAIANEKRGSVGAAIADYTRALEADPDDEDSKRALKRLQGFYFDPREKAQ